MAYQHNGGRYLLGGQTLVLAQKKRHFLLKGHMKTSRDVLALSKTVAPVMELTAAGILELGHVFHAHNLMHFHDDQEAHMIPCMRLEGKVQC